MISVSKKISDFKYDQSVGSFKGWLLKITRWRIADQLRKRQPLAGPLPAYDAAAETAVGLPVSAAFAELTSTLPDAEWEAEWEMKLLHAASQKVKRQLDPQKYQIFDFYVNKDWPPEKVAATFGITISQVYLAKHRVTEMIAEEVRKLELKPG